MTTPSAATRLALDCATAGLSLALHLTGGKTYTFSTPAARSSDLLPTALADLLAQSGTTAADISEILVTTGPGSFTGLRLGLATAEALKLLNPHITIIGLPTLHALALQAVAENHPAEPFTIVQDAAGGTLYTQTFTTNGTPQTEPACIPTANLSTGLLFAPTSLMLAAQPLEHLAATHLFTLAEDSSTHLPPQPVYLKPLTYKKAE
jgi:tRNA threonylcarbamoyl adenosine modification protein YeaZ